MGVSYSIFADFASKLGSVLANDYWTPSPLIQILYMTTFFSKIIIYYFF